MGVRSIVLALVELGGLFGIQRVAACDLSGTGIAAVTVAFLLITPHVDERDVREPFLPKIGAC